ncbi:hypothetical protein ACFLQX_00885 [Bacteroidota bacterium]
MRTILAATAIALFFWNPIMVLGQTNYELLYLEGNYEEIITKAHQLQSVEDYYWYAQAMSKQGKALQSIPILEKGRAEHQGQEKLELLLANLYYETGNFVKAKPLLENYSSSHEVFIRLIELLEFQDSYQEAIDLLEHRLQYDSLNLALLVHLGDNYYQKDSLKDAINFYDKVYKLNPDDQTTANKLASLLVKIKEYDRSIEICDSILWKDPLNRKFMRIKASASFSNKDYSTSQAYFKSLFALGDSGAFILKHLGISEFHLQIHKDSRKHLLAAYDKDPNDFETCFMLGREFLNSTTPEKGLFYLEAADSLLQPDSSVMAAIYLEKKSIYYTINDFDRMLECYKKAYEYDPQAKYIFYMASLYQNTFKEKELALEYYTRFLEMLPPPLDLSENPDREGQMNITFKSAAENAIIELKEELFFEGKLKQ